MRKFYIALCGGIVLTGCSNFTERHQASGNFDYLKEKPQHSIEVLPGYTPLQSSSNYVIPSLPVAKGKTLVGAQLDIRAPSLVMPVVPNSLVTDNNEETQVIFEDFLSQAQFKQDLWSKISDFIAKQGYGVNTSATQQQVSLVTNTIESDPYFKVLFGLEPEYKLAQQYQFNLHVEPQGHKAVVSVVLLNHQEQGATVELNRLAKRRYETRMMNHFLSQVYAQHNQQLIAKTAKGSSNITIELGLDTAKNTTYHVHAPFERTWELMASVLPKLGFVIDDRDKSINSYFTHFNPGNRGFWSSLFSTKNTVNTVALEKNDKFKIMINAQDKISVVTILDSDGNSLTAEKMTEMLGLFSDIMTQKQR